MLLSMRMPSRTRKVRPWYPWVRAALVALIVAGVAWGALELGQRFLGLQRLTIEQVAITGCRGSRLEDIQRMADGICLGKPLFWFDAEKLRGEIESRRWVKSLVIRRDPPDRVSLVIEERHGLIWLAMQNGVYLMADDGVILDRVNPANLHPVPVLASPRKLDRKKLAQMIRTAYLLRDNQRDFYDRVSELRWDPKGPVAYLEGLPAPIYLSRQEPTKNIPDFQAIFLERYATADTATKVRYFDLRWDGNVVAADLEESLDPKNPSDLTASSSPVVPVKKPKEP